MALVTVIKAITSFVLIAILACALALTGEDRNPGSAEPTVKDSSRAQSVDLGASTDSTGVLHQRVERLYDPIISAMWTEYGSNFGHTFATAGEGSAQSEFAASIQRVSGTFVTYVVVDTGWHKFANCTGTDKECDYSTDWPSAAAATDDPDWRTGVEGCQEANPACVSSDIELVSVSGSHKEIIWELGIFTTEGSDSPPQLAFAQAFAFNNLVLKVVDTGNPGAEFDLDVKLDIQTATGESIYVGVGDQYFDLTVGVSLGTGTTAVLYPCDSNITFTVSDYDDITLYDERFTGDPAYCTEIFEEQEWQTLGSVCEGDEFRFGFRMLADALGVVHTLGDDDTCTPPTECSLSAPLRVVLSVRVVQSGTCP